MGKTSIEFQKVTFSYDSMNAPLFSDINVNIGMGWTGIVGENGSGKTTFLKLALSQLIPEQGMVMTPGDCLYCSQRTDYPPDELNDFLFSFEKEALLIREYLKIAEDWQTRWNTLSHGERKRAQIGTALWKRSFILALDEPTNHLDSEASAMLKDSLKRFQGIGLLISHDRELLNALCRKIIVMEPPSIMVLRGKFTEAMQQWKQNKATDQKEYHQTQQALKKLKRKQADFREKASQSHKKRSKKGLSLKDHDTRFKKNLARNTGKDGQDGRLLNQLHGRTSQLKKKLEGTKIKKTYQLGIWQNGECSKKDVLFTLPSGVLSLGENRRLVFPPLLMKPNDRIALTGKNGLGKSTLIRHIMNAVQGLNQQLIYLPQEISIEQSQLLMEQIRALPKEKLGHLMTIISRLGTRPPQLLESQLPSPGEIRKILLAKGISAVPHLIVMDEPTNHLDLPSIECLEEALLDYPAGLLLVSHDLPFVEKLTTTSWHITEQDDQNCVLEIQNKTIFTRGQNTNQPAIGNDSFCWLIC